ncbi:MAG: rhamnulose-1-phosphate aldolase [Spirochaetota bacterium]|nr:rhamnulose-1-phosphate aldolase [Spirochaetota bacterium]
MKDEQIKKLIPETEELQNIAYWLALKNWSEANGGNISIRLKEVPQEIHSMTASEPIQLPMAFPSLAGRFFIITGAGCRMRDTALKLEPNIGLIRVLEKGTHYETLWGNDRPTSELPSHLAIHRTFVESRCELNSIVHTHPVPCIALTHVTELRDEKKLNDVLLRMQHETKVFLHDGIATLDYFVPGSIELGLASEEKLKKHRVLFWDKHGVMAVGKNLSQAFDLLEVIVKAAEIFWTVYQSGKFPVGLTDEQLDKTLRAFDLLE